jgi:hypothetical protein
MDIRDTTHGQQQQISVTPAAMSSSPPPSPFRAATKFIVLDGRRKKTSCLTRFNGPRISGRAPRALNWRVKNSVFLRRPSKSPVSLVGRESRRLREIRVETDQTHRTEAVKTGLCAAKTK